ncbi:hypothetical protein VTP01DRAFT_265 [Rhizomucor pusillus]|uniref:uncharacterized protein n=1 Tax=Rhizomucor pusillus TaxID=4840 RepID=UPI003744AB32
MNGVQIEFPFEPYPAKKQMMAKIIQSLRTRTNALLESPTGSGKSLAILCAALAWRNKQASEAANVKCHTENESTTQYNPPKIFIACRMHKQLAQLTNELRRNTRYRPAMAVLGSRDHLCIHEQIRDKEGGFKVDACKKSVEQNRCHYFERIRKLADHQSLTKGGENEIWDIEDLIHLGQEIRGCPYYAARALADKAEIIICPYNYLLDPVIRLNETDREFFKNGVYIFDEAYNLEDVARNAATVEVTEKQMVIMRFELHSLCNNNVLPDAHGRLLDVMEKLYNMTINPNHAYNIADNENMLSL